MIVRKEDNKIWFLTSTIWFEHQMSSIYSMCPIILIPVVCWNTSLELHSSSYNSKEQEWFNALLQTALATSVSFR